MKPAEAKSNIGNVFVHIPTGDRYTMLSVHDGAFAMMGHMSKSRFFKTQLQGFGHTWRQDFSCPVCGHVPEPSTEEVSQ